MAAATTAGALALAGNAAAMPSHYFLKPHQRCRANYVRKMVKVHERKHGKTITIKRVECVYKPTKPKMTPPTTPTPVTPTTPTTPAPTPTYLSVNDGFACGSSCDFLVSDALGYSDSTGTARQLPGQSITFTIIDNATGATVGSFLGSSNADFDCELGYTVDTSAHTQTFFGQAVGTVPACPLPSPVTMPSADVAELGGSFSGNSQYAASTANPQGL